MIPVAPIRVLLADDSATVRHQIARWLAEESDLDLVATAMNGRQAVERAEAKRPDVVLLDVEMPEMDGLEALRRIRAQDPRVPVIMFSAHTSRGGMTTLDALAAGASDYVLKPGSGTASADQVRAQLLEKIRRLHERATRRGPARPAPATDLRAARRERIDVLAVGSSTGGPSALETIFRELPPNLPFPILVVQHMPPLFTKSLAERLAKVSGLPVREATPDALAKPGTAWIAPGDWHMRVRPTPGGYALALDQERPENSCRPSVDVLFRSVAASCGRNALAVVLTGMGQDGLLGARAIVDAGGEVMAQDEASSVVWGMPGAVVNAGLASRIATPAQLAAEIRTRVAPLQGGAS